MPTVFEGKASMLIQLFGGVDALLTGLRLKSSEASMLIPLLGGVGALVTRLRLKSSIGSRTKQPVVRMTPVQLATSLVKSLANAAFLGLTGRT